VNVTISLPASDLALSIDRVKHAMASDMARPILAGMHFEITADRLRMATADNYRIAWADLTLETVKDREREFTIARDDVLFLLRWLKSYKSRRYPTPVTLTVSEERLEVTIGKAAPVLSFWLVDGTFPRYTQCFPEKKAELPSVSLNVRYLEDMGKAFRAEASAGIVKVYITDPLRPVLFEALGVAGGEIIMPVKTTEFRDRATQYGNGDSYPETDIPGNGEG